jgi:hypothetical protein
MRNAHAIMVEEKVFEASCKGGFKSGSSLLRKLSIWLLLCKSHMPLRSRINLMI